MDHNQIKNSLDFLKAAESLKDVMRSAHTSKGRRESTAEHTWRLCLWAIIFDDGLGDIDMMKLMKICVIHDLGEAISGDIPATEQTANNNKANQERRDFATLLSPLPTSRRNELLTLWDEYEQASSPEGRLVKGLDKLETILQHIQGKNPDNFDYEFNLSYGSKFTAIHPLLVEIRAILDDETRTRSTENPQKK